MHDYFKVYFDDKPFVITSQLSTAEAARAHAEGILMLNQPTEALLLQAVQHMLQGKVKATYVVTRHTSRYRQLFCQQFTPITAGGGLVANTAGAWLFIFRRGKWDLPKGKQDEGETIETCALREVEEETGLQQVVRGPKLGVTYHVYRQQQVLYLKDTHWYAMQALAHLPFTPQTEEDIVDIGWKTKADLPAILQNTYPAIAEVLHLAQVL
ncbi:MAG: NUDIX domain-containing protein [Chitinophagaceae bacterium]|jgi:8-oxo-dGTP pyrophosphatase MutT (NUDIX family)|nr:NUDIX domain-containing protein [Chitinophagaceae bacterium]